MNVFRYFAIMLELLFTSSANYPEVLGALVLLYFIGVVSGMIILGVVMAIRNKLRH